ncbi:hypothetical protein PspLS_02009 [Pyricularia sp. CBS 133598]|nr:hypothetical protein PspLS_02009 [Pyricularia sp. CBS 133598]
MESPPLSKANVLVVLWRRDKIQDRRPPGLANEIVIPEAPKPVVDSRSITRRDRYRLLNFGGADPGRASRESLVCPANGPSNGR